MVHAVPGAGDRRLTPAPGSQHPAPSYQLLKNSVVGCDEHGVRTCWPFICRDGTFPTLFFTTRTPITAGDSPTVPMVYVSSVRIFQISWAVLFRCASSWPPAARNSSSTFSICGSSGFGPVWPFEAYHFAKAGPI